MSNAILGAKSGLVAGMPIIVGYLPISLTFGALAVSYGLPVWLPIVFSALVMTGGTQFIMLGALQGGLFWPYVVALCAFIDSRHMLYGPMLRGLFPQKLSHRLPLAFALTDEVFGVAISKRREPASAGLTRWLGSVTATSYLSWVIGTAVGALLGSWMEVNMPALIQALHFALPALFICLAIETCSKSTLMPVIVAGLVATLVVLFANTAIALLVGVLAGVAYALLKRVPA